MPTTTTAFTDADIAYLRSTFVTLEDICAGRSDFTPDHDRAHFVPTCDTYIRDVRARHPQLWD